MGGIIENVNTGAEYPIFYYNDAPAVLGGEPQYKSATISLSPGNYRLIKKGITLPGNNFEDYPPTPAINTISLRLLLDTFESEDTGAESYLERFEIGGARIKKIIHRGVQGNYLKGKSYDYTYPNGFEGLASSGKLMDDLIFYKKSQGFYSYTQRGSNSFYLTGYNVLGVQPSARGSHIGYSFVREYPTESEVGTSLGWIDRNYHNLGNEYFTESSNLPYRYSQKTNGLIISPLGKVSTQHTVVLGLPPRLSYGYANGNVLDETIFDFNGILKSKTINGYVYLNGETFNDYFTSFQNYKLSISLSTDPQVNINTIQNLYNTEIGPWGFQNETYYPYQFNLHHGIESKMFSSKTILYEGVAELTKENILVFDDITHNLKSSSILTSTGKLAIDKFYYAYDSISAPQRGMNSLLEENQISIPVRRDTYLKDVLLKSQRTNFGNSDSTSYNTMPISVEVLKGIQNTSNAHYNKAIIYEKFGPYGKIRQYRNSDGIPITLVWGYNNRYVIAKIENAIYSDINGPVNNIVQLSNEDNDRTYGYLGNEGELRKALDSLRELLTNSMVTTYTYDPLVGVTSITDPRGTIEYFEYDPDNRLKTVFDQNKKILKDHDYKYGESSFELLFSNSPYTDPDANSN